MSNPFSQSPQPSGNPFADQVNPYAAPQQPVGYSPAAAPAYQSPFEGLWRQGNVLVMHRSAPLPEICLKSNDKATRRLPRSLSWHHPAIFILVVISPLIYIIVALILRKTATIQLPLTDAWFARRRQRMMIAWGLFLACVLLFFLGCSLIERNDAAGLLIALSICGGLGAAIYGLIACRLVAPTRMTDQYIWLKGVHPDFLNRLEVWQWNI